MTVISPVPAPRYNLSAEYEATVAAAAEAEEAAARQPPASAEPQN